jgi:hypothetical protein
VSRWSIDLKSKSYKSVSVTGFKGNPFYSEKLQSRSYMKDKTLLSAAISPSNFAIASSFNFCNSCNLAVNEALSVDLVSVWAGNGFLISVGEGIGCKRKVVRILAMSALEMLNKVVFSSEPFAMPLASENRAGESW